MTPQEAREIMVTEWECVDRQDTPKCDRDCRHCDLVMDTELVREAYRMATKALDQQQKTGHWIDTGSGQECSECGEIQYGYDNFRCFCANCGAKMEVDE